MTASRRALLDYEYAFRLAPTRDPEAVQAALYAGGLAGCYLGRFPAEPGQWRVGVPCRDPEGEARLLAEITGIMHSHFPETEVIGSTSEESPGAPGIEWVFLNGSLDGVGNREYDAA